MSTENVEFAVPTRITKEKPIAIARAPPDETKVDTADDAKEQNLTASVEETPTTQTSNKLISTPCPYKPPQWSLAPADADNYALEVLKDGKIIERIPLKGGLKLATPSKAQSSYVTIGRLDECDIKLEHPSISRWHAVLQYGQCDDDICVKSLSERKFGWYAYDLGSTHGTICNKQRLQPKQYRRVYVGHVIKFGGSTRQFIIDGPNEDTERESSHTLTEIKAEYERRKLIADGVLDENDADLFKKAKQNSEKLDDEDDDKKKTGQDEGVDWGFGKFSDDTDEPTQKQGDADEGEGFDLSTLDSTSSHAFYSDDPKHALTHFFEREGLELQFDFVEKGVGTRHQWVCRVELPINNAGATRFAEAVVGGSKKDAMIQCSLSACRILDSLGLLRRDGSAAVSKTLQLASALRQNDYYSSEEDEFLDRTGELEKKREKRKRRVDAIFGTSSGDKSSAFSQRAQTYDSLCAQISTIETSMEDLQRQLDALQNETSAKSTTNENEDALDQFMKNVSTTETPEMKLRKTQLRLKIVQMKQERERLQRMAKIAKPATLPKLNPLTGKLIKTEEPVTISKITQDTDLKQPSLSIQEAQPPKKEMKPIASADVKPSTNITKAHVNTKTTPKEATAKVYTVELPKELQESDTINNTDETAEDNEEPEPNSGLIIKKRRVKHKNRDGVKEAAKQQQQYDTIDEADYATWLPPSSQAGDGTTQLNQKYGY